MSYKSILVVGGTIADRELAFAKLFNEHSCGSVHPQVLPNKPGQTLFIASDTYMKELNIPQQDIEEYWEVLEKGGGLIYPEMCLHNGKAFGDDGVVRLPKQQMAAAPS